MKLQLKTPDNDHPSLPRHELTALGRKSGLNVLPTLLYDPQTNDNSYLQLQLVMLLCYVMALWSASAMEVKVKSRARLGCKAATTGKDGTIIASPSYTVFSVGVTFCVHFCNQVHGEKIVEEMH